MPADAHIEQVALTVVDLERSLNFYQDVLGFQVIARQQQSAQLGARAGLPLLELVENAGAQPRPTYTTGLYHFAIVVPTRADLGRSLLRLIEQHYPLDGASDHLVSEALYLSDPDGNGIEIYCDRPREQWRWRDGQVEMETRRLDLRNLAQAGVYEHWQGIAPATRMGHVHLQVGDLQQARQFYCDVLGFEAVAQLPGALFVSAGGYHHHLGLNTWHSQGAPQPPANAVGLRFFTISLPDGRERERVLERLQNAAIPFETLTDAVMLRDPWGNGIRLAVEPAL
ncbi:MAG: VOC family protein [Ktedonobacteraceae bacterium]|nr:VOC family protein [Ktedonobacteraceae bacterium]